MQNNNEQRQHILTKRLGVGCKFPFHSAQLNWCCWGNSWCLCSAFVFFFFFLNIQAIFISNTLLHQHQNTAFLLLLGYFGSFWAHRWTGENFPWTFSHGSRHGILCVGVCSAQHHAEFAAKMTDDGRIVFCLFCFFFHSSHSSVPNCHTFFLFSSLYFSA